MFKNFNNFKKLFFIFNIFIILSTLPLFSKPKKDSTDVYIKYVHPREYEFDLRDTEKQVFLGYNKNSKKFDAFIDFTRYVKEDMPRAGDKVTFYYKGKSNRDAKTVYANVIDGNSYKSLSNEGPKVFGIIKANQEFDRKLSFVITEPVENSFGLHIWSDKQNKPGKIDQCFFNFKRVVKTTDTSKEAELEKKAVMKNIEIVEVKAEIVSDAELAAQAAEKAAEISALTAELAAQNEAKRIAEEQEAVRIEAEKLEAEKLEAARIESERLALERKKQEEELQKAIDAVKSISRYEKEYLNDYMVFDDPSLLEEEKIKEEIIENPDETDSFGRTLLMKAAKAGNDWQIKTLLKSGAKVNLKDKDGWTALMYAVRYQESMECVNLLIDAGAEIKKYNKYSSSPLSLAACYNNNPEVLKKLLSYYSVSEKEVLKSLVLLLSENQTSEYIQLAKLDIYLNLSVPLNTFYEGKTPLMYAAEFGNSTKVLKELMDNNAITTIRSTEGKTAYDYASVNKTLKHDDYYWALNKK